MQSFFEQVAVAVLKKVDEKLDEANASNAARTASLSATDEVQALKNQVAQLSLALSRANDAIEINRATAKAKAADVAAAHAAEMKAVKSGVTKAVKNWLKKNVDRTLSAGGSSGSSLYQSRETLLGIKSLVTNVLTAAGANPSEIDRDMEAALHQQWLNSQPKPAPLPPIELDLHQLTTAHACTYVKDEIRKHSAAHRVLHIVTGKGNNSGPRGAQIKPAIEELLSKTRGVATYKVAPNNAGMLIVQL